jgi:hypothetical protein
MLRGLFAVSCAAVLTGCTAMADGVAVRAPTGPDDAVVALMDTGSYPTTPGPPPGTAGTDQILAGEFEAHRMGEYVVGPWQVDSRVVQPEYFTEAPLAIPPNVGVAVGYPLLPADWSNPLVNISKAHGFTAGFNTGRTGDGPVGRLQNVVLRFPDAESAKGAANDMVGVEAPIQMRPATWFPEPTSSFEVLHPPWRLEACGDYSADPVHPDFSEAIGDGNRAVVRSFTAHGPYVLYQFVIADKELAACAATVETLMKQEELIDRFVPTDPAKMAELPGDPTGQLYSRTLRTSDDKEPISGGVWQPDAWLHFEENPVRAAALFAAAGVDWVTQRLTRVYRARDAAGAGQVVGQFVTDTVALRDVEPTADGVPGFSGAKCFERTNLPPTPESILPMIKQIFWHFKCIARSDRYAFIAYSQEETDAKQQISAQYRILAGK